MLTKLCAAGTHFVHEMELKDIAILKFCLIALGTLTGLALPKRAKRPCAFLAAVVFLGTGAAILYRFFVSLTRTQEK